jgi:hypothetical protein
VSIIALVDTIAAPHYRTIATQHPTLGGLRRGDTADRRALMLRLPESVQLRPYWQYAGELVLKAAENNRAGVKEAWLQVCRAFNAEGWLSR